MTKLTGLWPICTLAGCDHARTQSTDDDVAALMATWVPSDGRASCACHGGAGAFPCDTTTAFGPNLVNEPTYS